MVEHAFLDVFKASNVVETVWNEDAPLKSVHVLLQQQCSGLFAYRPLLYQAR